MVRLRFAIATTVVLATGTGCADNGTRPGPECPPATPLEIEAPPDFPIPDIPAENPTSVEGVALGRRLFYDPILSGDSTQACGSCHRQDHAFGDPDRFSTGIDGIEGTRHAPTIINAAWLKNAFWDGRAATLEEQATEPVPNPIEMHLDWNEAVSRIQRHPEYPDLFCKAFRSSEITQDRVVMAIAQFERTFISADAKFDRYNRGETTLSPLEEQGRLIFFTEVGDCVHCHGQAVGFDRDFHNIGLDAAPVDSGLEAVTGDPADAGKFKTPSLRNVMASAPYMHDGRFGTIDEVLAHYNHGFKDGPLVDPLIRSRLTRPAMTTDQLEALKAFLATLTDSTFLNDPALSDPFAE
jgi:cytochrome c peroxidase